MITKLLSSKNAVANAAKIRDIFIEMLDRASKRVKNKDKVNTIINKIKEKEYSNIDDLIWAYRLILGISQESLYDDDLKIDGLYGFPTNPTDQDLINRVKELLS